tara:strand:- start:825 stop:1709 length:885 start_codon:yes stop_codon:yes gene_type:complete
VVSIIYCTFIIICKNGHVIGQWGKKNRTKRKHDLEGNNMADRETEKINKRHEQEVQDLRNHDMKGEDTGFRHTNGAHGISGEELLIKKKKEEETLKLLIEASEDFAALMDEFGDKLDDYNRVADRQNRRQAAFEAGDWDQYRLILMNDYDMNPDEVAAMSVEDFQKLDPELQELDEFTKETLKHELIQLAKDYDAEHGLTDEQKQALQELVNKSDVEGINFDEVFAEIRGQANTDFTAEVNHSLSNNDSQDSISDPFNVAANNDAANPFDLDNQNKSAPDPFSSTPSNSPNPFG